MFNVSRLLEKSIFNMKIQTKELLYLGFEIYSYRRFLFFDMEPTRN